jgi:two-component system, NtrC family, response regulator AtoC
VPTLLVIDDEESILHFFRRAFAEPEVLLVTATSAAEGLERVTIDRPDVVILDVDLPDQPGLEVFRRIHQVAPKVPVIFITGHGTTATAIEAMSLGAYEYLLKPLELDLLSDLVARAFEVSRLMRVPAVVPEDGLPDNAPDLLVGRCGAMQEVYKAIGRVAPLDVTVLILGETGTGKEVAARAIYHYSRRSAGPFLAINCAAIPESLLESELFGHEKGAFTGADRKRVGKFEQCHGGTIFMDEVGEMTPLTQAKILRVIQEQQFERVGGSETVRTDVRLIAATNADLERMADDGRFRKDLYFRLNVFTIKLPPLRDRGDDVGLLIDHFLKRFGQELGKPVREVSPEALAALRAYPWPGNVRELQSVLKQALLQMGGSVLLADYLPARVRHPENLPPTVVPGTVGPAPGGAFDWDEFVAARIASGADNLYAESLERMEREVLVRVLKHTEGNQLQAAKLLGITRGSLRNKIRALGISIARSVWSDDDQGDS